MRVAAGSKAAAVAPRFTRAASILAQNRIRPVAAPATIYPFNPASGEPEIIDRLQYILQPKNWSHASNAHRTIELDITADDLRKLLALAEANNRLIGRRMSSASGAQQPVARNALPTMTKHGSTTCNSCRFASTCTAPSHNDPAQHSASGVLAAAAIAAALFGTGAALDQDKSLLTPLHMSPIDVSNVLFCVQ
ncbi:hypothetical protein IWW38_004960 [Coemansia aciculifera]|uniref:Uncharacterized protein n=1 Tax=Coemansia aciculifera TaxID=417176 RepID=A0ACC1LXA0_9FUNG|nr:hypothetical protein IWW38_004960 [Coemansia aciculifera]